MRVKTKSIWNTFLWLAYFVKPYRIWVILCIVASIANAVVDMMMAYLIKGISGTALKGNTRELAGYAAVMAGIVVAGFVVKYFVRYSAGRFGIYTIKNIRASIAHHVKSLKACQIDSYHSGDMISRMTSDTQMVQSFLENDFCDFFYQPLIFTGTLIFMFVLNWQLMLINVLLILSGIIVTTLLTRPIKGYVTDLQRYVGKTSSVVRDTIEGIHMVKAFNLGKVMYEKYSMTVVNALQRVLKVESRISFVTPVFILMQSLPFVVGILYGGYMAVQGTIEASSLITFLYLLNNFTQPASRIPALIVNLNMLSGASARIREILEMQPERNTGTVLEPDSSRGIVEFENATFSYDGKSNILEKLNLKLEEGKITALVGPSGSGKSTVLKLLCGFYRLQEGFVKLYGEDLEDWNLSGARSKMSIVSQEVFLFPGTIAENISYGRPGACIDDIVKAAQSANIHDFVLGLPDGYMTKVGERGVRLSGGQKQRISIARAVLKDAPVLLLDEPTSALDTQSEELVQQALERFMQGRTVLVVAHRLSTIKQAAEVVVLNQGRIIENGSHEFLMNQDGLYRQLYLQQFEARESTEVH